MTDVPPDRDGTDHSPEAAIDRLILRILFYIFLLGLTLYAQLFGWGSVIAMSKHSFGSVAEQRLNTYLMFMPFLVYISPLVMMRISDPGWLRVIRWIVVAIVASFIIGIVLLDQRTLAQ